jgi:hypothetical protein
MIQLAYNCVELREEMTPFRFLSSTDDYLLLLWCSRFEPERSDLLDESVGCVSNTAREAARARRSEVITNLALPSFTRHSNVACDHLHYAALLQQHKGNTCSSTRTALRAWQGTQVWYWKHLSEEPIVSTVKSFESAIAAIDHHQQDQRQHQQ